MKAATLALVVALLPFPALAGNFATCLLDRLPGVKAPQVAAAAIRSCRDDYPAGPEGVKWGAGKGLFARYKSPDSCFASEAKDTALPIAVSHIWNACNWLYGEKPLDFTYDPSWKPHPKP